MVRPVQIAQLCPIRYIVGPGLQIRCVFSFLERLFLDQILFDHLLESSHRDDSNKWSNIGFGQETKELEAIEINFTHLIWSSAKGKEFNGRIIFKLTNRMLDIRFLTNN